MIAAHAERVDGIKVSLLDEQREIDLRRLRGLVEAAGYHGPIEVEIFNQSIWDTPGDDVLARLKSASLLHV